MEMRLQKYLAECGVASRRSAEVLIAEGRVTVNGQPVTEQGVKIDPDRDVVVCDGLRALPAGERTYIMLNKPEGYITSARDQFGRPTVLDLVGDLVRKTGARLYPVGRLDYDTSGLIILTDDGAMTHRLTHPSHNVVKTYIARVRDMPDADALSRFRQGLPIDGHMTRPAEISVVRQTGNGAVLRVAIMEGRNRQVRRMLAVIGHDVVKLKRVAVGGLAMGGLKEGDYRRLTSKEIAYLRGL